MEFLRNILHKMINRENRLVVILMRKFPILLLGIIWLLQLALADSKVDRNTVGDSSFEEYPSELITLRNQLKEQPDRIFEVDHHLKIGDEKAEKILLSRLFEKSKCWLSNLNNGLIFKKQNEIIRQWPTFSDRDFKNTQLLGKLAHGANIRIFYSLFHETPKSVREEDWDSDDLTKHKMLPYDLVYHVLNPRVISILNDENSNEMISAWRKDARFQASLSREQGSEIMDGKRKEISIGEIIGNPPSLSSIYINRHISKEIANYFTHKVPKDCREYWMEIYLEALKDGIKKYEVQFDDSCKAVFSKQRELPELTENRINRIIEAVNGNTYISSYYPRADNQGYPAAFFLALKQGNMNNKMLYYFYVTLSCQPEEVKEILGIFRSKLPQFVHDSFLEKLELKKNDLLNFLLFNSNIENGTWKKTLEKEAGPENIFKILEPNDDWKNRQVKPKSRVFKDISFGMSLNEVLNTNAVQSKAVQIQNNYDKDILENEVGHSDLYGSTELFGDKTILKMKFGWVWANGWNSDTPSMNLEKRLISLEFIPITVEQLNESDKQLIEGYFNEIIEGNIVGHDNAARVMQNYGFIDAAKYHRQQSAQKWDKLIAIQQKSAGLREQHRKMVNKWIKGLASGERPYWFIQKQTASYLTNNPSVRISEENGDTAPKISFVQNGGESNFSDINIAVASDEGLHFYPARKMDQTSRLEFITGLLAIWHIHETKRHEEIMNINKNRNDF